MFEWLQVGVSYFFIGNTSTAQPRRWEQLDIVGEPPNYGYIRHVATAGVRGIF